MNPIILHALCCDNRLNPPLNVFDFRPHANAAEPVFAADPAGTFDEGWLITQVFAMTRGETVFAVLDAGRLADGPVAAIGLSEPVPISFHGHGVAATQSIGRSL